MGSSFLFCDQEHLDTFWKGEGFESPEACFEIIKKGAEDARIHEAAAVEALHKKIQEEAEAAKDAAEGSEAGPHVMAGAGMHAPLPIPLESMLAQVGNLGEYTTFSIMIRWTHNATRSNAIEPYI